MPPMPLEFGGDGCLKISYLEFIIGIFSDIFRIVIGEKML
jgi:hypothetical protein